MWKITMPWGNHAILVQFWAPNQLRFPPQNCLGTRMAGGAYADAKMVNVVEISGDKMKKMHTHLHIRKYKDIYIYICGYIQLFYGYIQLYTVIYIYMDDLFICSIPPGQHDSYSPQPCQEARLFDRQWHSLASVMKNAKEWSKLRKTIGNP